ncbi:MAG TPA: response regulator [Vicinamibacteria bacterium]|nr:response regulator [Vicinamibacteria bacterium]
MSDSDPQRVVRPSPGRSPASRFAPSGPPSVLVVVPDPELRSAVEAALAGARTVVVPDASSALASAFQVAPDVVLADVAVGEDLVRALRADRRTRGVPVIVMTTRAETDGSLQGLEADADEYLLKPVPPRELAARVDAQARRAWARDELLRVEATARDEAESSNRAKDEFIAMISHELRTPLGAILIWAQLLKSDDVDPGAVTRAVGMIERSTKTLAQLIDDLLDASRIIAGKLTFETRPLELRPVIDAAFEAASAAAEAKGVLLEKFLPGPLPPVAGDPGRLQQVVGNLLANAVKFTPEGGRVEVRLARSGSTAHITIIDTGSGISPEFLPFIFERFRQADTTSTRKQKGLGLGLAIARQIVQLHGGTIEASSAGEGRGSTFTVKLPLLVSTTPVVLPPARGEERLARTPALDGITVLVVDDEEDAREAMAVLLGQAGARVISVRGAAEAIDTLDRERPDVLLSDIAMPGEDGYALIRRVRSRSGETGGRIPAAALTAYATLEDRAKAIRAGYDEHIPKPVDPTRLIGAVALLVDADRHTPSNTR